MATKSAAQRKKNAAPQRPSISSGNPRSYGEMYKGDKTRSSAPITATTATTATTTTTTTATLRRPSVSETPHYTDTASWHQEYDYVLRDLRTLGIVTAALFAVIILASFFI